MQRSLYTTFLQHFFDPGTLPLFVAKLPYLRQAWLAGNRLNGRIPEEWCARYAATDRYDLMVNIIDNPQVCLMKHMHDMQMHDNKAACMCWPQRLECVQAS